MSSSVAREEWRNRRTAYVVKLCTDNNLKLEYLNDGYQLRIEDVMDIYPTNGRWHFLQTGERGDWHTKKDLELITFEMLDKVAPKTYNVEQGEQPIHGIELTGVNKVTEYPVYVPPTDTAYLRGVRTMDIKQYNRWYRRLWRASKTWLLILLWLVVVLGALTFSFYHWYSMPCDTIKDFNLNAPGRCIR